MVQNIALLTFGAGALSTAVELGRVGNYWGGVIALVAGVIAFMVYEFTPTSK